MAESAILLARQPIYDAALEVAAYELLHRSVHAEHSAVHDGNEASSRVLLGAFGAVGIGQITEGKPAFINFTEHLIINPPPLDPAHLIVEVLEDVRATPEVLAGLRSLRALGFRIALDDFRHAPELEPLVELADIVKLDVLSLSEQELRAEVRRLRNHPVRLLAEKIESWEVFNHCVDLGFSYFQGYFLARPQPVHGRRMVVGRHTLLTLLAQVADPEVDAARLAATVATDPMLSLNLIRLVNSPLYRRARAIESLRDAIALLGLERVRGWCYLLSLARIDGKPRELTRIAMVRARFCELLGARIEAPLGARGFVLGVLSVLDAFLDQPLAALLEGMDLSADMCEALLEQHGLLGELLATVLAFERADWDAVPWPALAARGIDQSAAEDSYLASLQWVSEALAAIASA
jgi:EAL and modified HD-GYP domain-containing signal transduction protein